MIISLQGLHMRQKQSETQKVADSCRYILHRIYDGNT